MDTEKLKARNMAYLEDFLEKYDLGIALEDIDFQESNSKPTEKITSIYINFKEWSFQLYANKRTVLYEEDDTKHKKKIKMKKILLYNFSKRKIEKLSMEEIFQTRLDFIKFVLMFNQLKKVFGVEREERELSMSVELAKNTMLSSVS